MYCMKSDLSTPAEEIETIRVLRLILNFLVAYACQLKNYFYCSKEFLPARILDSDLTNDSNSIANVALHFPHPEPEDAILIV